MVYTTCVMYNALTTYEILRVSCNIYMLFSYSDFLSLSFPVLYCYIGKVCTARVMQTLPGGYTYCLNVCDIYYV